MVRKDEVEKTVVNTSSKVINREWLGEGCKVYKGSQDRSERRENVIWERKP